MPQIDRGLGMRSGWDVDLEAPPHISELNSAIAFLTLKNAIALFNSEMCGGASKSTSHPQTMRSPCKGFTEDSFDKVWWYVMIQGIWTSELTTLSESSLALLRTVREADEEMMHEYALANLEDRFGRCPHKHNCMHPIIVQVFRTIEYAKSRRRHEKQYLQWLYLAAPSREIQFEEIFKLCMLSFMNSRITENLSGVHDAGLKVITYSG